MDRQLIAQQMQQMAMHDPRFRVVHSFFNDLGKVNKGTYIVICRTRMPHVADSLLTAWPQLCTSKVIHAMKAIDNYSDADVVKISAVLLDIIVQAVAKTMESNLQN